MSEKDELDLRRTALKGEMIRRTVPLSALMTTVFMSKRLGAGRKKDY